MAKVTFKVN